MRMEDDSPTGATLKPRHTLRKRKEQHHPAGSNQRTNPRNPGAKDLQAALDQCRQAAREGYRVARESVDQTAIAIQNVSRQLQDRIRGIEHGSAQTGDVLAQLQNQRRKAMAELHHLQQSSQAALEERRKGLDEFSIALFGRTIVGKSTLMEILTDGCGASIGQGGQRTTQDVRSYAWKGLRVTDVPGVAAFEGNEDEELAFQAADMADLVIFLITDDAPQSAEAECLAKVKRLGKPVLGICNVKVALEDEDDLNLFLRSPNECFDMNRLESLVRQFHELVDDYMSGPRIRFVYTHLLSRFMARQDSYAMRSTSLERASRFKNVENCIIKEVVGRGKFLRVKSFIDGSAVPMLKLSDTLLEFSAQNSSSGRVFVEKKRQAISFSKQFRDGGLDRINLFVTKSMDALRNEIPLFAEDNFDRHDAGERWSSIVARHDIQRGARKLLEQLQDECRAALSEIARESAVELQLVGDLASDRRIAMDPVFDGKRAWNWGTTLLSGGLVLTSVILGSTPIGWAAAAVGVVGWLASFLFKDREFKVQRQRDKLAKRLNKDIDKIERRLRKSLRNWFEKKLLHNQVRVLIADLKVITAGLFELADAQRNLAWTLNREQKKLHQTLLREALKQLGHPELYDLSSDVARVPGSAMMLVIDSGTIFPGDVRVGLKTLLEEDVWFVVNTSNDMSKLAQAIGRNCDRRRVSIEDSIRVAHVPITDLTEEVRGRISLAQQLTGLHVMKNMRPSCPA